MMDATKHRLLLETICRCFPKAPMHSMWYLRRLNLSLRKSKRPSHQFLPRAAYWRESSCLRATFGQLSPLIPADSPDHIIHQIRQYCVGQIPAEADDLLEPAQSARLA